MALRMTVLVWMAAILCGGCSGASKEPDAALGMAAAPIVSTGPTGSLIAEKGDVSGDGKPDVWTYYKEVADPKDPTATTRVLVKKEADLNFDGKKDITRIFDDEGVLLQEDADLDFDGQRDEVSLYQKGVLTERLYYRGASDAVFIQKIVKDGKMTQLNRDDNGDGKYDYCEVWYQGEKLSKRGYDKDGNGECDYWENAE